MFSDLWGIMEILYYSRLTLFTTATLNSNECVLSSIDLFINQ